MVSLVDIYNINESVFSELKKDRNPARGNKGKNREKDFKLVSGEPDPETGRVTSKVVRKPSISNMVKDLEAEVQDFEKLVEDKPEDVVLYNISEELKEIYNEFRTHIRKKYPEEYKKVQEARLSDEEFVMTKKAVTGAGNGDPKKGADVMYSLMDKFERMA